MTRYETIRHTAALLSILTALTAAYVAGTPSASGQGEPVNGMRPSKPRTHAIVGATVVVAPGRTIENATIILREGVIEAVGTDVAVPDEARRWEAGGRTVYAGLIEPALLVEVDAPDDAAGAHWNNRVHPQVRTAEAPALDASMRRQMRELGFTAAAAYPADGAFRGTGAVLALAEDNDEALTYRDAVDLAVALDHGGSWTRATYPGSLMGAIALLRQTLADAQWHAACRRVYEAHPQGDEPPMHADALVALEDAIGGEQRVLFDVSDEHNALRAARVAEEFDLAYMLLGSGYEFRRLNAIAALGVPVLVPLAYPERPGLATLHDAQRVTLREMQTWEQAPTNARRLVDAGCTVALTTHRLDKRREFHKNVRNAIRHGLSEDEALAALTTVPAELYGLSNVLGRIEPGMIANLVVADGPLFEKKTTIKDVWINGTRHEIDKDPDIAFTHDAMLRIGDGLSVPVKVDTTKTSVSVTPEEGKPTKAKQVTVQRDHVSFTLDGRPLDVEGYIRFTGLIVDDALRGTAVFPDGREQPFTITPRADDGEHVDDEAAPGDGAQADAANADAATDDQKSAGTAGAEDESPTGGSGEVAADERNDESDAHDDADFVMPPDDLPVPLGAYGVSGLPEQEDVLITGATIWTASDAGIIENGDLLIEGGRIAYVGPARSWAWRPDADDADVTELDEALARGEAPERITPEQLEASQRAAGAPRVIDARGKHITPGLVDCHSHTGIESGINEWTQVNTAEVRIGDVVDPDDINWYRQLAGGLTVANQLHGSANPIGGQNSVVKLKWGGTAEDLRIDDAIPGIKFALGENVKRSEGRYPNTRMGVETTIVDAFTAAREYEQEWDRYLALDDAERARRMPPRRDLELDALVEILHGERLVHCHSYRQDEILMLIRIAERFGFTIGTLQHVLEGYKVADDIARHGAGGSSFSDWWAYKVEVMDAIPHNGSLMTECGVNVSFNSDSSELARRMNTEAAKAVRYGGMDPHDALKLVTINPARQLRIEHRTGSLEVGKDADFVIWSGDPLSTYTICEQTWIEGAKYFDREADLARREAVEAERRRLIQKILAEAHGEPSSAEDEEDTEHDGGDDAQPDEPQTPEEALLARVIAEQRALMAEQVRLGRDPEEVRPGECGCSDWWTHIMEAMSGMHHHHHHHH